jgi:hypothetical protein
MVAIFPPKYFVQLNYYTDDSNDNQKVVNSKRQRSRVTKNWMTNSLQNLITYFEIYDLKNKQVTNVQL